VAKQQRAVKYTVLVTGTVNPNQVAILWRSSFGTYLLNTT